MRTSIRKENIRIIWEMKKKRNMGGRAKRKSIEFKVEEKERSD